MLWNTSKLPPRRCISALVVICDGIKIKLVNEMINTIGGLFHYKFQAPDYEPAARLTNIQNWVSAQKQ
jgi:hypothetical protein